MLVEDKVAIAATPVTMEATADRVTAEISQTGASTTSSAPSLRHNAQAMHPSQVRPSRHRVVDTVAPEHSIGGMDRHKVNLHLVSEATGETPNRSVINVIWKPNQITLPHNHRLSAVIGMYGGREDNVFLRRVPNPEKFQIEVAGGQAPGTGDVAVLGRDIIHSVINPVAGISNAIHVYDGDFINIRRGMWDAETLEERPYDMNVVAGTMPSRPA